MKYNLKICLPIYKIMYPIVFLLGLSLVRGISYYYEIGPAMDANVALLAIVFFADTYYLEIQGNTSEVFHLMLGIKKYRTILQRLFINWMYLVSLVMCGYWAFLVQHPLKFSEMSTVLLYLKAVFACSVSIAFFGILSFTLVNKIQNLWVGIGLSVVIWLIFNSTLGQHLPSAINVFAYGGKSTVEAVPTFDWCLGKITAICCTFVMIILNKKLIIEE